MIRRRDRQYDWPDQRDRPVEHDHRSTDSTVVLVTGASTGIGRASAVHLAKRGMHVFAGVRCENDAQSIRDENIPILMPVLIDVTDPASIAAAATHLDAYCGDSGLFALVNNAGVALGGPQESLEIRDWQRVFDVNVFGVVAVTRAMLPLLRKATAARIVNMSSPYGTLSIPFMGPYCASKHALESISSALRLELSDSPIFVSVLAPSDVKTPIWDKAEYELIDMLSRLDNDGQRRYDRRLRVLSRRAVEAGRQGMSLDRVARAVEHVLTVKRPKERYSVGVFARWCEVARRILPSRILEWLVRRYTTVDGLGVHAIEEPEYRRAG